MSMKNLLIVFTMWQIATAQENCPGVKLATGIGSLLGDIPISNCAPELPFLPELPCGGAGLPWLPSLPSLPYGDCGCSPSLPSLPSAPCLPELPPLADFGDYPCFGEPLPYLKKKGCGCLDKPSCLKSKPCGCSLEELKFKKCLLKEKCLREKEDLGLGLKIVPLIKKFPIKQKTLGGCGGGIESLPCELPSLVSDVFRGSLYDGCY